MHKDRRQRRRGHPVDPPRLPQCLGSRLGQPLDHLARQPADRGIVQRRIEQDRLIRRQRAQLGFLPRDVGCIMGILGEFGEDRRIDRR
jgi:hypothetical protein